VDFKDLVSYRDSVRLKQVCNVLLLYGNLGAHQILAKTYMYLATGKPILYIGSEREYQIPTWPVLKKFPGVIRCTNTKESILSVLCDLEVILPGPQKCAKELFVCKELDEYRWDRIGEQFSPIIRRIVSQA
jgi:hypothetical protein